MQKLGEALRSRTQSCNHTAGEEARNRHELEFPFDLMVKFLYRFPLSFYGNAAVRFMRMTADDPYHIATNRILKPNGWTGPR
jgi:hypothetical protein